MHFNNLQVACRLLVVAKNNTQVPNKDMIMFWGLDIVKTAFRLSTGWKVRKRQHSDHKVLAPFVL